MTVGYKENTTPSLQKKDPFHHSFLLQTDLSQNRSNSVHRALDVKSHPDPLYAHLTIQNPVELFS